MLHCQTRITAKKLWLKAEGIFNQERDIVAKVKSVSVKSKRRKLVAGKVDTIGDVNLVVKKVSPGGKSKAIRKRKRSVGSRSNSEHV